MGQMDQLSMRQSNEKRISAESNYASYKSVQQMELWKETWENGVCVCVCVFLQSLIMLREICFEVMFLSVIAHSHFLLYAKFQSPGLETAAP